MRMARRTFMRPTSRKPAEATGKRRPARVGELACLPLFFPLKGRKVVIAGGTDAAAWKAELLAAAGANVQIYAERPGTCLEALLEQGSPGGTLSYHPHSWTPQCFSGAALAVADAASIGEAKAFQCAAKVEGVPVNVIDNPQFCEFQFGSIVNRSPVVIGISTNGAAPILGQAIRRRIETLLPHCLKDWAALARRVRSTVLETLSSGSQRRSFWESFTDLAFSGRSVLEAAEAGGLEPLLVEAKSAASGKVTFVGGAHGDAEDLTLKAVRALQSADVILFDERIDDSVLELARREAKRVPVELRSGREICLQEGSADMMISLANQGRHVVRLKTGDPVNDIHAGKEFRRLAVEGIPVTIVPGIASTCAMVMDRCFTQPLQPGAIGLSCDTAAAQLHAVTGYEPRHGKGNTN